MFDWKTNEESFELLFPWLMIFCPGLNVFSMRASHKFCRSYNLSSIKKSTLASSFIYSACFLYAIPITNCWNEPRSHIKKTIVSYTKKLCWWQWSKSYCHSVAVKPLSLETTCLCTSTSERNIVMTGYPIPSLDFGPRFYLRGNILLGGGQFIFFRNIREYFSYILIIKKFFLNSAQTEAVFQCYSVSVLFQCFRYYSRNFA